MINETIHLWDKMDCHKKTVGVKEPTLSVYAWEPSEEMQQLKSQPAVLICPGGGYGMCSDREAEPVMSQFLAKGYICFILRYSVFPAKHPQPLLDVSRALWLIRENAGQWRVDTEKIGVMGFSAGGHLAASLGVHWNKPYLSDMIKMPSGMNKPNALMLCYPVISAVQNAHTGSFDNLLGTDRSKAMSEELSCELHVADHTPPTFLWHTADDNAVPVQNSLVFSQALAARNIPFEMHIYPKGWHGLSICTNDVGSPNEHVSSWVDLCIKWLDGLFKNQ